jgi:hypothetical protein
VSDQDFDKMFEDAANEQDFLFSTDSWDEVSSMLDRNDPQRVDAAFAQGIEEAHFEATEAGFESAMSTFARIKSKRRRKAIAFWSSGVFAVLLLTWYVLKPSTLIETESDHSGPKMELNTNEVRTTEPIETPNKSEIESAFENVRIDQKEATEEAPVSEGAIEPLGSEIKAKETRSNRLGDADNERARKPVTTDNKIVHPDASFVASERTLNSLEEERANKREPVNQSSNREPSEQTVIDFIEPNLMVVSRPDLSWIPQSGEFTLPNARKGVGPEGLNDWGIIVGGRSMRLKDVPDGFDITKYSPEVGVRYARRLNDLWSLETEFTGYMIAGTQGSVSFARTIYGMGEATQYRYIESDQSVQLELPVRLRYRIGGRHFVSGGVSAAYMLPTDIRITEEVEEWYGTESLGSQTSFGYVYGMRRFNLSWTLGYQYRLSDRLALNSAVNYYMLDRDLLDSEALVPIPWQIRVGVHYSLFR